MDLIKYFQGIKGAGSLPAGLNPATWMLQVSFLLLAGLSLIHLMCSCLLSAQQTVP